jgi:hypothetical protein
MALCHTRSTTYKQNQKILLGFTMFTILPTPKEPLYGSAGGNEQGVDEQGGFCQCYRQNPKCIFLLSLSFCL